MKKILLSILIILLIFLGIGLIWLTSKKGTIEVSKSIEIRANPQKVYGIISNFHTWSDWSPWLAIEPESKIKIIGNGNEKSDVLEWNGDLIGSGMIEHELLEPNKIIHQKVTFLKPFKSEANIEFRIDPTSDGVTVEWKMKNKMPFLFRFLTDQMEGLISLDFERGLKMLKDLAETDKVASRVVVKGIENFEGFTYVGKEVTCPKEMMTDAMNQVIYEVNNWLVVSSTFPEEALSMYKKFDMNSDTCTFVTGYRLINPNKSFPYADASMDSIPNCKVLKITFYGDYKHLGNAWTAGYAYMQQNKIKQDDSISPFEIYLNDPSFFPDPSDWVTDVCIPVKK